MSIAFYKKLSFFANSAVFIKNKSNTHDFHAVNSISFPRLLLFMQQPGNLLLLIPRNQPPDGTNSALNSARAVIAKRVAHAGSRSLHVP